MVIGPGWNKKLSHIEIHGHSLYIHTYIDYIYISNRKNGIYIQDILACKHASTKPF